MPPEPISGRDVELIAVGVACVLAAGWLGLGSATTGWQPAVIFALLAGVSFGLALWDIRERGELSFPR